jgi:hemerythrin-like domain-containing protein
MDDNIVLKSILNDTLSLMSTVMFIVSVPDEGYSRNALSVLDFICTFSYQLHHCENKLHFNEMMSALFYTPTHLIGVVYW